jgi:hypothetical protein
MIWSRVDQKITSWTRQELAKTAAEFHFVGVVNWILKDGSHRTREIVREFAVERRLFDVILGIADLPPAEKDAILAEIPSETLLARNVAKLAHLGVEFSDAELLMEKRDLKWKMDEFWQKVGNAAPTLLLVEMRNGTECGGVAGVPWPPKCTDAEDPSKVSCIFSLGATPTRFDFISADNQATCSWPGGFQFGSGYWSDLVVLGSGEGCYAWGRVCYAGPQGEGSLIGTSPVPWGRYARWELWRL